MKIAVTYDMGMVFQHFGHTSQFKIYDIEGSEVLGEEIVNTNGAGHCALAEFLTNLKVDVLICGGIGPGAINALTNAGIDIYPGVMGEADLVVNEYLAGILLYDPDTVCDHHSHSDHECGDHGCHDHDCQCHDK